MKQLTKKDIEKFKSNVENKFDLMKYLEKLLKKETVDVNAIQIKELYGTEAYGQQKLIINRFFRQNEIIIWEQIANNNLYLETLAQLIQVFNEDDSKFRSLIDNLYNFTYESVKVRFELEINYFFFVEKHFSKYYPSHKKKIQGEYLLFHFEENRFEIIKDKLDSLIYDVILMPMLLSKTLHSRNSEWLEAYMGIHKDLMRNSNWVTKKKDRNPVGRPGKFKDEKDFHNKVKDIPGWKELTNTELAKRMGYKSGSGLNELIKSNNWDLPK